MHLESHSGNIFVAGHRGLVGSAITRTLQKSGYTNLLLRSRGQLDLRIETEVARFFETEKPQFVVLAAAKVGGILANSQYPADFLVDNLRIQTNVIRMAHETGVKRLLFLGSSCIYPRLASQPLQEHSLLSGPLEETNDAYAIAKIAGIFLCRTYNAQFGDDFISAMPTNLYGPADNYDLKTSHVLPALIRKFHEAKQKRLSTVTLWGSGKPRREFLHSTDLAEACLFLLKLPEANVDDVLPDRLVNIGVGEDLTILELAETIRSVVGVECTIQLDRSKPDGTPRKLMDVQRMRKLGWQAKIGLREGIEDAYSWYLQNEKALSNG